jgi:hypothetical protein
MTACISPEGNSGMASKEGKEYLLQFLNRPTHKALDEHPPHFPHGEYHIFSTKATPAIRQREYAKTFFSRDIITV